MELSTNGIPQEKLLEIVINQLNREDVSILTYTIEMVSCNIIEIDSHSRISIKRPDIIETVKKKFIEKFETTKRLGWSVTRSWIIANLFVEGVENVELIEP